MGRAGTFARFKLQKGNPTMHVRPLLSIQGRSSIAQEVDPAIGDPKTFASSVEERYERNMPQLHAAVFRRTEWNLKQQRLIFNDSKAYRDYLGIRKQMPNIFNRGANARIRTSVPVRIDHMEAPYALAKAITLTDANKKDRMERTIARLRVVVKDVDERPHSDKKGFNDLLGAALVFLAGNLDQLPKTFLKDVTQLFIEYVTERISDDYVEGIKGSLITDPKTKELIESINGIRNNLPQPNTRPRSSAEVFASGVAGYQGLLDVFGIDQPPT